MRLSDVFSGANGKSIMPLVKNSTVVNVVEIGSNAEIPKKIHEIKKTVSKLSSSSSLIVVFE